MDRHPLLRIAFVATTLASPSLAFAGGVNFGWNSSLGCYSEGGAIVRTFACDTNLGTDVAVASFVTSRDQPLFVGIEGIVDLQFQAATLPAWWDYVNAGSCRSTSLSVSSDFLDAPQSACVDAWMGLAQGGVSAYQTAWTQPPVPNGYPNTSRLKVAFAVPSDRPSPLSAGIEYYAFRIALNHAKTVGAGSCAGCSTPVCLTLTEIKSAEVNGAYERITSPIANKSAGFNGYPFSCAATPAANLTWGQLKGFYR